MPNDCKQCAELRAALEPLLKNIADICEVESNGEGIDLSSVFDAIADLVKYCQQAFAQQPAAERVAKAMYQDDIQWFKDNGPDDELGRVACDASWRNGCYHRKARAALRALGMAMDRCADWLDHSAP